MALRLPPENAPGLIGDAKRRLPMGSWANGIDRNSLALEFGHVVPCTALAETVTVGSSAA